MAKRNSYGPTAFMMTLFVLFFPILVSGFDKKAVIYASLSLCLIFFAYETVKKEYIVVSKSFLIAFIPGMYALLGLIYVSDKGSQVFLAAFLFLLSSICALAMFVKQSLGEDLFQKLGEETVFKCGAIYSVGVILWQVFIDSKFISSMNMGQGSSTATAIVAFVGFFSGLSLCRKGRRSIGHFVLMGLMLYAFIMSRSIVAYLMVTLIIFVIALNMRHKKVEAFIALVISGVFAVVGLIYTVTLFVTDAVGYKGALMGLWNIFGVGSGGYEAAGSVVGAIAFRAQNTIFFLIESMGIFGLIFAVVALWGVLVTALRRMSLSSFVIGAVFVTALLSSVQTFIIVMPLCCIYYGACGQSLTIKVHKSLSVFTCPGILFCILIFFSRIPFSFGANAYDVEAYKKGGDYFEFSAQMALFDSEGWERAYECAVKDKSVTGATEREYLENALKFNKKNYEYKRLIAKSYKEEGNFNAALSVWEEIMEKYDDEYLYEDYSTAIMDVMSTFPDGVRMEDLYGRICDYAEKATDKDVKFKVNNILAKSQAYYIESREMGGVVGDMYQESPGFTEEVTEYESSSAES